MGGGGVWRGITSKSRDNLRTAGMRLISLPDDDETGGDEIAQVSFRKSNRTLENSLSKNLKGGKPFHGALFSKL